MLICWSEFPASWLQVHTPYIWRFHIHLRTTVSQTENWLFAPEYLYSQKAWEVEEYLSSTCGSFQKLEKRELTCLVYFNPRTISYFVQQPYEAGFKVCREKRKRTGFRSGHHFQSTRVIQELRRKVQVLVGTGVGPLVEVTKAAGKHWLAHIWLAEPLGTIQLSYSTTNNNSTTNLMGY